MFQNWQRGSSRRKVTRRTIWAASTRMQSSPNATVKSFTMPLLAPPIVAPSSCTRSSMARPSIDHKEPRARRGVRPVRFDAVGDLVAHTRQQLEAAPIGQIGIQLPGDAQQDMALLAPVVRHVAGRIVHHAYADGTE